MSTGPAVATATVRIVPDTTGFRAELQRQVAVATKGVTASVQAQVAGTAAAANAAAVSGVRGGVGSSAARSAAGTKALANESNLLRGSLIGLSRVTPVTVFGLGLYGTAAIAAGYAIKGAIRSTADFEHQLYVFQATTGATAEQMVLISEKAKALGADLSLPSTSAGDAALAMTELAKAGLTVEDTLAGSTGVLQLAAAAQLDVGSAAQFVATQLNAFGLSGEEATHVADLLAGASIAAQGDIRDFGTSFQQVSAVAKQADVSIETTTGALTELAKAGLRGADGGTSLRTAILRLTPTTKQAADYQKILGIELDKNRTIGEQFPELLDQYKASLQALTPIQRQQALTQIFGQDAYRAAAILIEGGSKALDENTKAADQNGAANRLAQANAKGLSGAFNGLKSNLDTLGITLGGFVSGPLTSMVKGLSGVVTVAGQAADALSALGKVDFKLGLGGDILKKYAKFLTLGPAGFLLSEAGKPDKEPVVRPFDLSNNPSLGGSGVTPAATIASGRFKGKTPAEKAAIQARFRQEQEDRKRRKPLPGDTNPANKLEIAQLNAQLSGDLQAELTADKAIEGYFQKRLKLATKGTDRYVLILGALRSANAASVSVQDQINSEAKASAAEAKAAREEAKRIADEKKRDAAEAAKDLLALEFSRFDLAIQRADLSESKTDDVTKRQAKIRRIEKRIKYLNSLKNKTTEEKQAIVDLRASRLSLLAEIKGLKNDDKSGGGASPEDFFRAAVDTFREYGGGGSFLSAQDVRGDLAGRILGVGKLGSASKAAGLKGTGLGVDKIDKMVSAYQAQGVAQGRRADSLLIETRRQTVILRRISSNTGRSMRSLQHANSNADKVKGA